MKRNMDADETLDAEQRGADARQELKDPQSEDQRSAEDHDLSESPAALSGWVRTAPPERPLVEVSAGKLSGTAIAVALGSDVACYAATSG